MKVPKVLLSIVAIAGLVGATTVAVKIMIAKRPVPEKREAERKIALVETTRAEPHPVRMNITAYGTAEPKTDLFLVAQVSGRVTYLAPRLRAGNFVRKDESLLRIDPRPFELAKARAQALVDQSLAQIDSLTQDKKNLEADLALWERAAELAKRAFDRAERLQQSGSESQTVRDVAEEGWVAKRTQLQAVGNQLALLPSRLAAAQAALAQARAQFQNAQLDLEYAEILAPFDGRVSERLVEAGQYVAAGTRLARIHDPRTFEIALRVPLEDFHWIDRTAFVTLPGDESAATAPHLPRAEARREVNGVTWRWAGEVTRVDAQLDRATRTAGLIVEMDAAASLPPLWNGSVAESATLTTAAQTSDEPMSAPPDLTEGELVLVPGLFLEVEIEGRLVDNVVTLPRGAIDQDGRVYVAEAGRLAMRPVRVLRSQDGLAYIAEGLREGEEVILSPLSTPVEGMGVQVAKPEQ